ARAGAAAAGPGQTAVGGLFSLGNPGFFLRRLGFGFRFFGAAFGVLGGILPGLRRGRRGTAAIAVGPAAAAAMIAALPFQMAVIGRLDVRDVQEAVAADAEIDECRLNARLDVDDATLVNVADVALLARALDV